jgi:hypothetical protein
MAKFLQIFVNILHQPGYPDQVKNSNFQTPGPTVLQAFT